MAGTAIDTDFADDAEDDVLGGDTVGQRAVDADLHGLGFELAERLRREYVLDFGGSDTDGEAAEGAVGGGMAIPADHGFAGQRVSQIGTDDMNDALIFAETVEEIGNSNSAALRSKASSWALAISSTMGRVNSQVGVL